MPQFSAAVRTASALRPAIAAEMCRYVRRNSYRSGEEELVALPKKGELPFGGVYAAPLQPSDKPINTRQGVLPVATVTALSMGGCGGETRGGGKKLVYKPSVTLSVGGAETTYAGGLLGLIDETVYDAATAPDPSRPLVVAPGQSVRVHLRDAPATAFHVSLEDRDDQTEWVMAETSGEGTHWSFRLPESIPARPILKLAADSR